MGNKTSSKIQKIESFLNDHFDIRFNTITNLVEARSKEEVCFSAVNEKSIYRSLHHHGIRASIQEIQRETIMSSS